MRQHDVDATFYQLTAPIEEELRQEREQKIKTDFAGKPETRPIPEGLIPNGLPLGHIALRGDFESPETNE